MNIKTYTGEIKNGSVVLICGTDSPTPELAEKLLHWFNSQGLGDCLLLFSSDSEATVTVFDEEQMRAAGWERTGTP